MYLHAARGGEGRGRVERLAAEARHEAGEKGCRVPEAPLHDGQGGLPNSNRVPWLHPGKGVPGTGGKRMAQ